MSTQEKKLYKEVTVKGNKIQNFKQVFWNPLEEINLQTKKLVKNVHSKNFKK